MIAIEAFEKGSWYRHDLPGASLDVQVLSIYDQNDEIIVMGVRYYTRNTGRPQVVKPHRFGDKAYFDKVRVKKSDLKYWTKLKGRA